MNKRKYSSSELLIITKNFESLANSGGRVAIKNGKLYKYAEPISIAIFVAMIVVPIIVQAVREHMAKAESLKEAIDKLFSELDDLDTRFEHPMQQISADTAKGLIAGPAAIALIPFAGYKAYQLNKEYPKYQNKIKEFRANTSLLLKEYTDLIKLSSNAEKDKSPEMQQKLMLQIDKYNKALRKVQLGMSILANDMNDLKTIVDKIVEGGSFGILQSDFKDVVDALGPLNAKIAETVMQVDKMVEDITTAAAAAQKKAENTPNLENKIQSTPKDMGGEPSLKPESGGEPSLKW